jgi:hypothetical protein
MLGFTKANCSRPDLRSRYRRLDDRSQANLDFKDTKRSRLLVPRVHTDHAGSGTFVVSKIQFEPFLTFCERKSMLSHCEITTPDRFARSYTHIWVLVDVAAVPLMQARVLTWALALSESTDLRWNKILWRACWTAVLVRMLANITPLNIDAAWFENVSWNGYKCRASRGRRALGNARSSWILQVVWNWLQARANLYSRQQLGCNQTKPCARC